jgi:hypothetical protein
MSPLQWHSSDVSLGEVQAKSLARLSLPIDARYRNIYTPKPPLPHTTLAERKKVLWNVMPVSSRGIK